MYSVPLILGQPVLMVGSDAELLLVGVGDVDVMGASAAELEDLGVGQYVYSNENACWTYTGSLLSWVFIAAVPPSAPPTDAPITIRLTAQSTSQNAHAGRPAMRRPVGDCVA